MHDGGTPKVGRVNVLGHELMYKVTHVGVSLLKVNRREQPP